MRSHSSTCGWHFSDFLMFLSQLHLGCIGPCAARRVLMTWCQWRSPLYWGWALWVKLGTGYCGWRRVLMTWCQWVPYYWVHPSREDGLCIGRSKLTHEGLISGISQGRNCTCIVHTSHVHVQLCICISHRCTLPTFESFGNISCGKCGCKIFLASSDLRPGQNWPRKT